MSKQITNQSRHLAIVPLNSGDSVHLRPGEISAPIADFELERNVKLEKLRHAGIVALSPAAAGVSAGSRAKGSRQKRTA